MPVTSKTPRLFASALFVAAGAVLTIPATAHAAEASAAPAIRVAVTDLDGSTVRAGHHLRYDISWASNGASYKDAWIDVELDGSGNTGLLDQLSASPPGTVMSSIGPTGQTVRSILWNLGAQAKAATGSVSWTAVVTGSPAASVPAICAGAVLRGPLGSTARTATATLACTAASSSCAPAPALTMTGPAILAPSARGTYSIALLNTGALSFGAIGLQLPGGYTLASSSPQTQLLGGLPTFSLGAVSQGQQLTMSFDVTAPAAPGTAQLAARLVGVPVDGSCLPPNVPVTYGVAVVAAGVQGATTGGTTASTPGSLTTVVPVTGTISTPATGADLLGGRSLLGILLVLAGLLLGLRRRRD